MSAQTKYEQYENRLCAGKDKKTINNKYGSPGKLFEKKN